MNRLFRFLVIALAFLSLFLTACGNSSSPETPTITVGTDATWPPFESLNAQTRQFEGLDIDIIQAIAEKQNLKIEFKNERWDPLLAGIAKSKYDVAISSIIITEERKKDMLFSEPYFAAGQIVVVPIDNTAITAKDRLSGPIGVQQNTRGETEVQKIKGASAKPYEKISQAFEALISGEVNAVVCDNPVALIYVGRNPDKLKTAGSVFTDEKWGIAVAKEKKELLKKINAGLKSLQNEGLIEQFSQKWLK